MGDERRIDRASISYIGIAEVSSSTILPPGGNYFPRFIIEFTHTKWFKKIIFVKSYISKTVCWFTDAQMQNSTEMGKYETILIISIK